MSHFRIGEAVPDAGTGVVRAMTASIAWQRAHFDACDSAEERSGAFEQTFGPRRERIRVQAVVGWRGASRHPAEPLLYRLVSVSIRHFGTSTHLSLRTPRLRILARAGKAEELADVERPRIIDRTLEASRDFGVGQTAFRAQVPFDLRADDLARTRQLARHRRFVLSEQAAGLCEGQVLAVVTAEPETIAVRQKRQRPSESKLDERR